MATLDSASSAALALAFGGGGPRPTPVPARTIAQTQNPPAAFAPALPSVSDGSVILTISDEVAKAFKDLKQRRSYAWLLLRVDGECLMLDKSAPPSATAIPALLRALPSADGRYVVIDQETKNSYGGSGSRILLCVWAPPSAGRSNVIYAAQRRALNATFKGVIDCQASKVSDVEAALASGGMAGGGGGAAADEEWDPDA